MSLQPFAWMDKPALIEHLFPVQKISAESFKEQSAVQSKTLVALGSYWKGRKPLVLNKACILGALLPITDDRLKDLEIFEMLMGMDAESLQKRMEASLPASKQHQIGEYLVLPFNDQVRFGKRAEEIGESLLAPLWAKVNAHLGTSAKSTAELVEQMGIARFGHRPRVGDVFSGSGQIPFEAARLGCDVYASDLNPMACLLTWGSFNIVGTSATHLSALNIAQKKLVNSVQQEIDALGIETDGNGWRAKAYLYCVEVVCPESGWSVPVLPTLIVSASKFVVVKLYPDEKNKRYEISVHYCKDREEMEQLDQATLDGGYLVHTPHPGQNYRVKINNIRGDVKLGRDTTSSLRKWVKADFIPREHDVFQERLYCVQWEKIEVDRIRLESEFRSVGAADLTRESKVIDFIQINLNEWQDKGYIPDMVIERGYNTDQPIRERGWTYWHHLFAPRQLLMLGLIKKTLLDDPEFSSELFVSFSRLLDWSTKLCRYGTGASRESIAQTFYNQALNTFYNYGVRPFSFASKYLLEETYNFPLPSKTLANCHPADSLTTVNDIYVTDPPYGDAVKYEEITEFFIAWLRKNPPKDFSSWTWDSRRSLAIKGEDEGFRTGMVAAYRNMANMMPDNGIQVLMFTHQSGAIWADMANIIWASGLQVTAAWYVVTETDSALRGGSNVKGTVILVLRKRHQVLETFRDDLGWEIEDAVKEQVESLIGLDKKVRAQNSEGLYTDADLQMAGYAAALKVLTAYSRIDGKDMVSEAEAPRQKGQKTFVDELINFAVQTAVQFLVPVGFEKGEWQKLQAVERFYLKMLEIEHQGAKTLDNYQNFAKAFKVNSFDQLMSEDSKANAARLKLSSEFKGQMMSGETEIAKTPLRAILYAIYELSREAEIEDVLLHLMENCPNYLPNRLLLAKMAAYIGAKREGLKATKTFAPELEASCARVLSEAIRNQRL